MRFKVTETRTMAEVYYVEADSQEDAEDLVQDGYAAVHLRYYDDDAQITSEVCDD